MTSVPVYSLPWMTDKKWMVMTMEHEKVLNGFLTPMQYAIKCGVHYHTVLNWIAGNSVQFIRRQAGRDIWYLIPANAAPPKLKTGPKPKDKP